MIDSAPITWFTEDPTPILVAGGIALFVLLGVLFKTGRGVILLAMAAVALCMALSVLIDCVVVTEREAVENVVYLGAEAAGKNDLAEVEQLISPSAEGLREQARRELSRMKFKSVSVGGLRVNTDHTTEPWSATARFLVRAEGDPQNVDPVYRNYAGRLKLDMKLENGQWRVTGYEREQR